MLCNRIIVKHFQESNTFPFFLKLFIWLFMYIIHYFIKKDDYYCSGELAAICCFYSSMAGLGQILYIVQAFKQ